MGQLFAWNRIGDSIAVGVEEHMGRDGFCPSIIGGGGRELANEAMIYAKERIRKDMLYGEDITLLLKPLNL